MPAQRVLTRVQDQDDFTGSLTDALFLKYSSSLAAFTLAAPARVGANDYRLSLTQATPYTTADVTGATTIYHAPVGQGNSLSLYSGSGSSWNNYNPPEYGGALGTLAAAFQGYDVFSFPSVLTPSSTNTSTDIVTFASPHGITTGAWVTCTSTIGGLTAGTDYWFNAASGTTGSFHTTLANALAGTSKVDLTANITQALTFVSLEFDEWTHATVTCTSAAPGVVTWTAHGLATGNSFVITSSSAVPTGLTANTQYFLTKIDANTFKLSTTLTTLAAGTFITTSSTGTGTLTGHSPTLRQTALVLQNGVWSKTGDLQKRYIGALMTTATTTTEDSVLQRYLDNFYWPADRQLVVQVSTSSQTYAATAWAIYTNSLFQVRFFLGLNQSAISASANANCQGTSTNGYVGIGLNRVTTSDAQVMAGGGNNAAGIMPIAATYDGQPAIGYNSLVLLNSCQAASTVTFFGNAGLTNQLQSGLRATIWA